ncbi:P-loop containing nucleoside triphosphate hydrolase protein [Gigaspora rosea]|uniref:P-loop containing nucleoside triphosphate hydrolase protein n=1 Tax=Gigaspora rosea TaxID=44941 RepID=A0A397U023_9GLOM|nr:P-loop containing nucleoside triphosphate hydrolase protein [Gigaspora rosea]CAG8469513.1 24084_t:CDS:2 [Gigaspora rosea]
MLSLCYSHRLVRLPYSSKIIKNSNQIRQNHFDSKTYQVFTRLRERFTRVSFARFASFGIIGTATSVYLIQEYNDLKTMQSFFNAKLPPVETNIFKERKEMEQIKRILTPTLGKHNPNYYLIIGPHGCGKSTLVNFVAGTFKKGIIHVEGSDDIDKFGENFAKDIGKLFKYLGGPYTHKLLWRKVLSRFEEFATKVVKKHSIRPVLIIDDIAKIAKEDPKVVENLQNVAKTAADHRLFTVVFVASDANLIDNFMINNRNIDAQIAKRIFDICGGRISHIVDMAYEVDELINLRKSLGKSVDYNDNEFCEKVIKVVDEQVNVIKQSYRKAWDSYVPENSKRKMLQFLCNNLDAEFTRGDIIRLFDEGTGEYIFSTLLKNNIITDKGRIIEFGAPVIKIMLNELCEKEN